jgi:hypothetical protein
MKRNMLAAMERLRIDEGIRDLMRQLWKHCYRTTDSCEGHGQKAYILFSGGDGWFEDNAQKYGLTKVENGECCEKERKEIEDEMRRHGINPRDFARRDQGKSCHYCGAGINGNSVYQGVLI